jgi:hypothetical protein
MPSFTGLELVGLIHDLESSMCLVLMNRFKYASIKIIFFLS